MIKNIFLPEKFGAYALFPKRILGFDIGKTHVNATQVYIKGTTVIVEKQIHEAIENGNQANYSEKVTHAIAAILAQADKSVEIHTALSSSVAVFKTLKLPFTQHEKIKMVIGYEIEPLLPFSLSDAIVDFIITKTIPQEGSAEILVAALQKQHVEHHLKFFQDAGVAPTKISIDLFDLYGLYQQVPAYANNQGGTVLIDLGFTTTRIAYLYNGQLRMIRSLAKGSSRLVKTVSDSLQIQPHEVLEKIIRFGITKSDDLAYNQTIEQAVASFWKEIQFTLNSFMVQEAPQQLINNILLLGGGAELKGLPEFVTNTTTIACEQFSLMSLLTTKHIQFKNKNDLTTAMTLSFAAALPSPTTEEFNLLQKEFSAATTSLFIKQLIVTCSCVLIFMIILLGHSYVQKRKLKTEIQDSEKEIITTIKKSFTIPKEETDLEDIVASAEEQAKKEQDVWFAFSGQARSSFLKYLLELHALDKENLGLDVEKITIGDGVLTLKAKVKDYEALKLLEKELRKSKLFSYVEPVEKTDFTMKIILIKNGEGE